MEAALRQFNMSAPRSEIISVPDRMVGLSERNEFSLPCILLILWKDYIQVSCNLRWEHINSYNICITEITDILVIGKGGEQIAAIQNESECRVQFAPGVFL